jgi:reactive intermediate/imine deaminase
LALCLVALVACQTSEQTDAEPATGAAAALDVEYLASGPMPGPFSEAVRIGNVLILSGQIGLDPETGALAPGGIQAETRQTLENIRTTLERYGSSMDRVVKCTAMLVDIEEWPALNEVYATYFPVNKPARSAFAGSGLARGARVELECWATVEAVPAGN